MALSLNKVLLLNKLRLIQNISVRNLKCSRHLKQQEGWLSKLLMVRKIEPGTESHSRVLSDSEVVYELQVHDVKPNCVDDYLQNYEQWIHVLNGKAKDTEIVGSFRVEIGDQDQFLHIWRYNGGYPTATKILDLMRNDLDLLELGKQRVDQLRARQNQFLLSFSFWGHPDPRPGPNMYEMRSYVLKPGTMIEWGNNWARGINYRKGSAVAGFFSQIGQLYTVHHLWGFKDLQTRKEVREDAWRKPGWDDCVAHTVPLIREMQARWMSPTVFSPLK